MKIRKVLSKSLLLRCRKHLARDAIANVLPLSDLYHPLFRASRIHCAIEQDRIIGVVSVYHAYETPSVVLSNSPVVAKKALVKGAMSEVTGDFVTLCTPEEADLFKRHATILRCHSEYQMTTSSPKPIKLTNTRPTRVKRTELSQLNTFYKENKAEAWTPIQFRAGPYYCIKQEGRIVCAAGVHAATPQIAQLGNIVTDEAYRNLGFGTTCTSALATHLASTGRIISLFVRVENASAIHMYEKLSFTKTRNIVFNAMHKKDSVSARASRLTIGKTNFARGALDS